MNRKLNANIASKTGNLSRRLAKHFAALAIPAVIVPAAHAGIVWSGPVNLNIQSTVDGVYLNVLTGANGGTPAAAPGWDVNPYGSSTMSFWSPNTTTHGFVAGLGSSATLVDNLALGTMIDGSQTYNRGASETTGATAFMLNSDQNLAGFRFVDEGDNSTHYGWLRVSLAGTAAGQPRTLVDYAYESTAGLGIGAGVIPEPASAALLLLGLGGLFGLRGWSRRQ